MCEEAIRISGGWATIKSDFETLADVFLQLYKQPAKSKSADRSNLTG